jgi:hypothetical protein
MWFSHKATREPTLKTRVDEFWEWYSRKAAEFYTAIEAKRCGELQPEVSATVDRLLPGMAWVFGPGENRAGHSFTLSGEGVLARQFVAEYWQAAAPKLHGWTFYASRQPSDNVRSFRLELDENRNFEPQELWLHPVVDEETEKLNLTAWHPLFASIPDNTKWTALFLLLDEALGEHGTQNWIGEIQFADSHLKESIPVWELPDVIRQTESKYGWKKLKPTDIFTTYKFKEPNEIFRGDTKVGSARYWSLVRDYLHNKGPVDHPCPDIGVDFVFVAFTSEILPKGEEVVFRGEIEDNLIAVFSQNRSGDHLGGAMGMKNTYIDAAIYDGEASIQQIQQVLKKHALPKGTAIHYFTRDKADRVITL